MYLLPKFKIKVNVSSWNVDSYLDFQTKSFKIEYFIKLLFINCGSYSQIYI